MGYLVLPITVGLLLFRPVLLLPWGTALCVFHAAAVINVTVGESGFGLQPGYLGALAICVSAPFSGIADFRRHLRPVMRFLAPVYLLAGYAAVSGLVLPHVFADKLMIFPPREGIDILSMAPLGFSQSNVTQIAYICFLAVFATVLGVATRTHPDWGVRCVKVFFAVGAGVMALAFYQIAAQQLGLPYPFDFFNSNVSVAHDISAFMIFGDTGRRASGSFAEPSVLACYATGLLLATTFAVTGGRPSPRLSLLAGVVLLSFFLILSTTGFVSLAVALIVLGRRVIHSPRARRWALVALVATILATATIVVVLALQGGGISEFLATRLEEHVLAKGTSDSVVSRWASDVNSLVCLVTTAGLGVGWGSTRSSSFVTNLLANGGAVGGIAVLWLALRVSRLLVAARQATSDGEVLAALEGTKGCLIGMLIAATVGVPDATNIILWYTLAIMVGLAQATASPAGATAAPAPDGAFRSLPPPAAHTAGVVSGS
ncbi:MAG TPA: hypothetical protein VGQ83_00750 [Polyangia bacterium]